MIHRNIKTIHRSDALIAKTNKNKAIRVSCRRNRRHWYFGGLAENARVRFNCTLGGALDDFPYTIIYDDSYKKLVKVFGWGIPLGVLDER